MNQYSQAAGICPTCFYTRARKDRQRGTVLVGCRRYCDFHAGVMCAFLDSLRGEGAG